MFGAVGVDVAEAVAVHEVLVDAVVLGDRVLRFGGSDVGQAFCTRERLGTFKCVFRLGCYCLTVDLTVLLAALIGSSAGGTVIAGIAKLHELRTVEVSEHQRWLRDQKLKCYLEIDEGLLRLSRKVIDEHAGRANSQDVLDAVDFVPLAKCRMLCPEFVCECVSDVLSQLNVIRELHHGKDAPTTDSIQRLVGDVFGSSQCIILEQAAIADIANDQDSLLQLASNYAQL